MTLIFNKPILGFSNLLCSILMLLAGLLYFDVGKEVQSLIWFFCSVIWLVNSVILFSRPYIIVTKDSIYIFNNLLPKEISFKDIIRFRKTDNRLQFFLEQEKIISIFLFRIDKGHQYRLIEILNDRVG